MSYSPITRLCLAFAMILFGRIAHADDVPKRLDDAHVLLKQLDPKNNKYVFGGNLVTFGKSAEVKTDCSGLLNQLLKHSDGFDDARMRKVFGATRPTAKRYYDAIVSAKDLEKIEKVEAIRAGDILAIAYVNNYKGKATGHVLLAAGKSQRMDSRNPLVEGTTQWELSVIDSATNGHGPTDTRRGNGENGANTTGIGKGIMRIYADRSGKVAGYTWTTQSSDKGSFYPQEDRPMAFGRLRVEKK
jgi:hypothetical protein